MKLIQCGLNGLVISVMALMSNAVIAHDSHTHASLTAHVHGVSEVNIVLDQQQLMIEWQAPAMDVLGFEHATPSATEQAKITQFLQDSKLPSHIVNISKSADCQLEKVSVAGEQFNGQSVDYDHADISLSYQLSCQQPQQLKTLAFASLFERFPSIEQVNVQLLSSDKQIGINLTPQSSSVDLPQ